MLFEEAEHVTHTNGSGACIPDDIIMAHQQDLMAGLIAQYKLLTPKPSYHLLRQQKDEMSDTDKPGSGPTKDSKLTLREITKDDWYEVASLELPAHQQGKVAPNAMSMLTGLYNENAWMRAVYADETVVGFLLMKVTPAEDDYFIWRFMIDEQYQRLGFGRRAVELIKQHVKETYPQAKRLGLNSTPKDGNETVKPEHSPYAFYQKLGFHFQFGPNEDNEVYMDMAL